MVATVRAKRHGGITLYIHNWLSTSREKSPKRSGYLSAMRTHVRPGPGFPFSNLLNKTFLKSDCSGADGVIHLAALSSPFGRYRDFFAINVQFKSFFYLISDKP